MSIQMERTFKNWSGPHKLRIIYVIIIPSDKKESLFLHDYSAGLHLWGPDSTVATAVMWPEANTVLASSLAQRMFVQLMTRVHWGWLDKQTMVYPHSCNRGDTDPCHSPGESSGHYVQWNVPASKGQIPCTCTSIRSPRLSSSQEQNIGIQASW